MSFLAIWRDKHPGQPNPDEATMKRFQLPVLTWWREEHPGQSDPDGATLYKWLCAKERQDFEEDWREAFPGRPLPDDYEELRRWAIRERAIDAAMFIRHMDAKQGKKTN